MSLLLLLVNKAVHPPTTNLIRGFTLNVLGNISKDVGLGNGTKGLELLNSVASTLDGGNSQISLGINRTVTKDLDS